MPKKTGLQQLQDSINELFGQRKAIDDLIAYRQGQLDERRLDKNALAKARRLAEEHGIDIEKDGAGEYWVTHPDLDGTENDPCEGNHFCCGGREVLQAVQAYVDYLKEQAA